ncbi:CDP-diacylglycerol--glycerol-3-phosphate 3-phosphatidyltransferase [Nocardioides anomalus]|uniref:CDP-diacylglycerol--glycerol-3-phosphate 3-phosphatidyltransferase n=1 Tax=Nocardioides anomalus TaxID=2712223 RepID=A0A6G6WEX3_9ACTN|nr:CDP-diacylglycerol--glycerol-3-phosphate 3-phosphatidyltransferase [Nocardioides anomalus]QIG43590.1 CDP-diacylglycerol--glycerol-3-phosphate 3-phosphatidyltransferase [Nocardioides anomalus]
MTQPQVERPSNLNLPNVLTCIRILLVPFFGAALLVDDGHSVGWRLIAWAIFVVAMITDKIDGDIARKRGLVTDFGKIADPIADKAMTGMAFVGIAIIFDSPWWWVITIVVLVREWSVTLLRLSVLKRVVIAADQLGKLKTTVQVIGLGGLVLPFRDPDLPDWMHTPGDVLYWLAVVLTGVAVVLTVVSGAQFFLGVWRQRHALRGR